MSFENVFIVGTGRCGTTTFARACHWITNYSSGHETTVGVTSWEKKLRFGPKHIESDPHIVWYFPQILRKYPQALYVHLKRNRDDVVKSWLNRYSDITRGPEGYVNLHFQCNPPYSKLLPENKRRALGVFYDSIIGHIEFAFATLPPEQTRTYQLEQLDQQFPEFWRYIEAQGDLENAILTCRKRHNIGRR